MKRLLVAIAFVVMSAPAFAGSHTCDGIVTVGPEWSTVVGKPDEWTGDYEKGCKFKTTSPIGKRILAKCPDKSNCSVHLPLKNLMSDEAFAKRYAVGPDGMLVIKTITGAGRL